MLFGLFRAYVLTTLFFQGEALLKGYEGGWGRLFNGTKDGGLSHPLKQFFGELGVFWKKFSSIGRLRC